MVLNACLALNTCADPSIEFHWQAIKTPSHLMNAHLPGVTVHGRVASAEEFTKNHGVSVIPLLSGSGVRIKLLENGCHGIPTVSTSIGAGVYSGADTIIPMADDAESFAKQVVKLCTDILKANDVAKALHEDISRRLAA